MYYISAENKVYVHCPKGFREVEVTKGENDVVYIKNLKEVNNIKVKEICVLAEVIARYLTVEEVKEEIDEETVEEVKEPKKGKK